MGPFLSGFLDGLFKAAARRREPDVHVLSAVPEGARELIERFGLLSSMAATKNPEVLRAVVESRRGTRYAYRDEKDFVRQVKKRHRDAFWRSTVTGPSVFFGPPDPSKIGPEHPMRAMKTRMARINLSRLLEKEPGTVIHGSELRPYDPKGPRHQGHLRHKPITIDDVRAYVRMKPEALWRHYSDPEGRRYAGDVPHAQVVTPSGAIAPEFIEFL